MKANFPKKIVSGSKIRVISPSSSGATLKKPVLKCAEKRMKNLGYAVTYGKYVFQKDIMESLGIEKRLDDFHTALKDKQVSFISCIRGGYTINTLLPYIDWDLLKKNPKVIMGYSDITALLNAVYVKTGLVTYLGPSFSSFGQEDKKGSWEYTESYLKKCVINDQPFEITASKYVSERKTEPKKNKGVVVIQKGRASGTIIGGNLCTLNLLQGTEYMPSLKDVVLFIEEDDFGGAYTPHEFERNLESLLQLPDAKHVKGIVFGRFQAGAKMSIEKLKYILSSKKISKKIPVVANADFGHTMPMVTIPIGGEASIETTDKSARIVITKH